MGSSSANVSLGGAAASRSTQEQHSCSSAWTGPADVAQVFVFLLSSVRLLVHPLVILTTVHVQATGDRMRMDVGVTPPSHTQGKTPGRSNLHLKQAGKRCHLRPRKAQIRECVASERKHLHQTLNGRSVTNMT